MTQGLAPHGYCLLWDPALIWLHVISDTIIGLSYFSIPIALSVFLARRRDIEFGWLLWLFALFIMACGTTHFLSILVLWVPLYGIEGLVKLVTAAASVLTAAALWPLLPKLIALPSPRQLQQANAALQYEAMERARMEEERRQSQKLEAIGQLTGGIAHDFNNILTVVIGSIERAARVIDTPDRARVALERALEATGRATALTAQLLAFARKTPMQIEAYDVNHIIHDLAYILELIVGESITVLAKPENAALSVDVDRSQLETALINLAANARDAMPNGGILTIETFADGADRIAIRVSDTGIGMAPDTLERATEPFYTTKAVGQGTGLGLSQAYGFARQVGGELTIESTQNQGTRITITLPRTQPRPADSGGSGEQNFDGLKDF
jgi:signal transduction histidine kinase